MQTLAIAKEELWLHRDGQSPRQLTSAFACELVEFGRRGRVETLVAS